MKDISKKSNNEITKKVPVMTILANNFKSNGSKHMIYCSFCKAKTDHNITKCLTQNEDYTENINCITTSNVVLPYGIVKFQGPNNTITDLNLN